LLTNLPVSEPIGAACRTMTINAGNAAPDRRYGFGRPVFVRTVALHSQNVDASAEIALEVPRE
jgi:hypothetical protein